MKLDKELLQACIDGDRRSQYRLYKESFQLLMSICSRYKNNRDDCLEMLNLGFFKVLTNLSKYHTDVPFEAWVRRIMINCLIDEFRKWKREREIIEYRDMNGHDYHYSKIDFNQAEKMFNAQEIEFLILKLPERTRAVFNLYVIDGYAHKEIAEMMEISVNTSKWHLSDARKKLQKMLKSKLTHSKIVRYGE